MAVRRATREDLPGILEIYNHAVLHTTATYDYEPRTLEQRTAWFETHEAEGYPVFVVCGGTGMVMGWSSLNRHHDRPGYRFTAENSIYVAESFRGRGLGGRLMAPLIEAALEKRLRTILAVIDAQNEASLRLHRRYGFETAGLLKQVGYKFDRWLDVVFMQRMV
ncbi:MAG: N-acetyltransferase family protein [Verrucomicrobia bacterium]|nr:N-acetyltransferase family protein [Verrucomicrobiota bacterium]